MPSWVLNSILSTDNTGIGRKMTFFDLAPQHHTANTAICWQKPPSDVTSAPATLCISNSFNKSRHQAEKQKGTRRLWRGDISLKAKWFMVRSIFERSRPSGCLRLCQSTVEPRLFQTSQFENVKQKDSLAAMHT